MKFILEYNSYYKEGSIVLIEYWYNSMVVPVRIIERINNKTVKVSYNVEGSDIQNAPDEIIKTSLIIDEYRK